MNKNKKHQKNYSDKNENKKIEEIEELIIKIKTEFDEEKNKFLRNIADLHNQIKRNEKNYLIEKNKIKKKYLIYIIDILELLKKAYKDKNSKIGIKLIINNIEDTLKDEKVQYIECIGKEFNHNLHHAISTVDKKDCLDNIVVEEIKKGYYLDKEILRPSQVIVQKKLD